MGGPSRALSSRGETNWQTPLPNWGASEAGAYIASEVRHLGQGEGLATLAHQRLAAVGALLAAESAAEARPAWEGPEGGVSAASEKAVALERAAGHTMVQTAQRGWTCRVCRQGPGKTSLVDWLERSQCRGDVALRSLSEAGTPVLVPPQAVPELCTATRVVHSSHTCAMLNGIVWCWRCAHYGSAVRRGVGSFCWLSREQE